MSDSLDRLRAQYDALASRRSDAEPEWLAGARRRAFDRFLDKGFPTTRDEDWRFTSVAKIAETELALATGDEAADGSALQESLGLAGNGWHELVFVDGRFSTALSKTDGLPDGVIVDSLSSALASRASAVEAVIGETRTDETAFYDLNEAFAAEGAFVFVPSGVHVEQPVHVCFLTTAPLPVAVHSRVVVHAERSSQLCLVESYAGRDDAVYWNNVVTDVRADDGAVVEHYKLQLESKSAFHVASLGFRQGRDAVVSNHSLSVGAALARNDIYSHLGGRGADVTLNGLYVVGGSQHVDHHTVVDHAVEHCTSRELYKGVLDDHAVGVFNGRVIVRQDAQKTDSVQSNKNLLLSDHALVHSNPQLEIHADDVKCAHGATIGQLDEDMVFYLRSRGIGLEQARTMLTQGFMADVSERIRVAPVKRAVNQRLFAEPAA